MIYNEVIAFLEGQQFHLLERWATLLVLTGVEICVLFMGSISSELEVKYYFL